MTPVDLAFDPFSPGTIYAPTQTNPQKSTDDGQTWAPLTPLPTMYYQPQQIIPDPRHRGTLYVSSFSGLFKSTDGGATWTNQISQSGGPMALDTATGAIYAAIGGYHVVRSADGFDTVTPVGPPAVAGISRLLAAGSRVFVGAQTGSDVFVVKRDAQGNVVYSTYFGGSASELARSLAVDSAGSVYVTGTTNSLDFPVSPGAYSQGLAPGPNQSGPYSSFLFKLNPDGSLAYSTYFVDNRSTPYTVAADGNGNAYIAGTTFGGLPVTPGAYQATFVGSYPRPGGIGPGPPLPTNGFLTKFNASGSALVFSTYIGSQQESVNAIAVDPRGSAYLAGMGKLYRLSADGSSLLSSTSLPGALSAIVLDQQGDLYVAGGTNSFGMFPVTAGAFQTAPPSVPGLPGQLGGAGAGDAFVTKLDGSLKTILASTLIGGESTDFAEAVSIDASGNIIVGGFTDSKSFPLLRPAQGSFAQRTGFIAGLTPDLSGLLFSTNSGDTRSFVIRAVVPEPDGSISFAGDTVPSNSGIAPASPVESVKAFAANFVPGATQLPRVDTVVNAASQLGVPLSPGETIQVRGDGFAADAGVFLGDQQITALSIDPHAITATVPADFSAPGATTVKVISGGVASNGVLAPVTAASPGVFSVDGTGFGQGYILNADGTRNSPDNPAAESSRITIFATGVGQLSLVGPYAVTAAPVNVFIDGFYTLGVAAITGPVPGLPGDVYQITIYVPHPADHADSNPNLKDFKMPPQVAVTLEVNGAKSQAGLALAVKQ